MTPRRVGLLTAVVLAAVYVATLAPGLTFWDAGEFIAAAHAFGVPHPPGTPLYILILHTWGLPWPDAQYAFATNLFSALVTAVAGGWTAALVTRWFDASRVAPYAGVAAGLCAGAMSTVWSNATETEVYAASLLVSVIMLVAADRAGSTGARREGILVAYLFGLAAALHASALVAAPAAVLLASTDRSSRLPDRHGVLALTAAALTAMGVATASPAFAFGGLLVGIAAAFAARHREGRMLVNVGNVAALLGAALLGATPMLVMLVRARFDPAINQGNPRSVAALVDVVARRQYDLAPLWPRRAPLWLQVANWFDYADWQVALSLGPSVVPTVARTAASVAFALLAVAGARAHWRSDRRSALAVAALAAAGSLGVVFYLNLKAGPSFGWGILPDGADREARERDYFFVLGFWALGVWAGVGAVSLARRFRLAAIVGVAVAALPLALNWTAVTRRAVPDALIPERFARSLLEPLPDHAVLFVAGDNDTYPVWYLQEVRGLRRDVTVITAPLFGADWYRAELVRRHPELGAGGASDVAAVAAGARAANRPIAASAELTESELHQLSPSWIVSGTHLTAVAATTNSEQPLKPATKVIQPTVDTTNLAAWVRRYGLEPSSDQLRPSIDPTTSRFAAALDCPARLLALARRKPPTSRPDSTQRLPSIVPNDCLTPRD